MAKEQTNGNLALEQQSVIVIPAHDEIAARKLRVAAYARVSSSSEDQLNSYRVQNQYYSELISNNPDWEMVDIYADEGITGTSVEKREDFQRMMQDCRKGNIDRILVKSISRFARNTKDCLAAVRELKELGVSVQFEEQGIDTARVSSEMVTAIMASLAQKGSESISGNVQWGYQKRMESGKFNTCKAPYGFRLQNGQLVIEENEASVVRQIFDMFLNGNSREEIADALRAANLPTRKDVEMWAGSTVYHILRNERYQSMYALQWYLGFFEHGGAGFPYSLYYHQQDFSRALSKECAITKFTLEGQDGVISNREITVKIPPLPLGTGQLAVAVLVKSLLRAVEHELHRTIWGIANDLRGSVDGWDFKQYVLGMLFYRYISENFANYINDGEREAGDANFDYAQLSDSDAEQARDDLIKTKGFFILPSQLFCSVRSRAPLDENLNETLEAVFQAIEDSAKGSDSEANFSGLFDDIDVNNNKLGGTVAERNKRLVKLMNGVGDMKLGDYRDNTIDAFGDAYEYLMGMYASNAGKSGGEYFTPQEVSELLTRIAVAGKTEVNKVYEIKTRYLIQNTAA